MTCKLEPPLASRQGILSRSRQLGAPAPGIDLRRGWFLTQIGAADRGGQLDLKIVGGLLRGLCGSTQHRDRWPARRKRPRHRETKRVEWNVIAKARQE